MSAFGTLIDGIEYTLNSSKRTASVTSKSPRYAGDVIIPPTVTFSGTTYSVTSIEGYAFSGCSDLTSITIPASVTSIASWAFSEAPNFTKAEFASIESLCKISFGNVSSNPLYFAHNLWIDGKEVNDLVIPNSVTSIASFAFCGYTGETSVEIPNSVKSIGRYAFYECSGLTSIKIPESITTIGDFAFYGCTGLIKAEFPSIEWLSSFNFKGSNTNPLGQAHNLWIDGKEIKDLVIPATVTRIGNKAFVECTGLTSVEIPNSVISIDVGAFAGCTGLTELEIPNSVTTIGESAFSNCSELKSVKISESLTSISPDSFSHCTALTSIKIPESVTSIGNNAFAMCSGLKSVELPGSITSIGHYSFQGCVGLSDITIPNSVTSIGVGAFRECTDLPSIVIPESITSLNNEVFRDCTGMTFMEIPATMTSIGEWFINGCVSLTSIECNALIPPKVTDATFYGFNCEQCKLFVTEDALDAYKAHPVWSKFFLSVATGMDDVSIDRTGSVTILDIAGHVIHREVAPETVNDLNPGIYIVRQGNKSLKIAVN